MKLINKYKVYVIFVLITIIIGFLAGLVVENNIDTYNKLEKSIFTPPHYLFFIIWIKLYVLMSIGAAIIYEAKSNKGLIIYAVQLMVNFSWSFFFFEYKTYFFSFLWIILLILLVIIMIVKFYHVNKKAAYLQIPYLLWLFLAAYLNFVIYLLN